MSKRNRWAWQGVVTAEEIRRMRQRPERVRARRLACKMARAAAAHAENVIVDGLAKAEDAT